MEVSGVLRSWDMARSRLLRSFSLSLSVRALSLSRLAGDEGAGDYRGYEHYKEMVSGYPVREKLKAQYGMVKK